MEIIIICPMCGETYSITVNFDEYLAYESGELAQNAFKSLSAVERESLISGLCPTCQAKIFE